MARKQPPGHQREKPLTKASRKQKRLAKREKKAK